MASPLKPLPRRLFELLEEQQEPFLLHENDCSKRSFKSRGTFRRWSLNSHGFRRRRARAGAGILRCFVAAKLVYSKAIKKALNSEISKLSGCFSEMGSDANAAGFHRLPTCSVPGEGELSGEIGWKVIEHSPVSVFELHSDEGSSDHNHSLEEENQSTASRLNSPTKAKAKAVLIQPRQLLLDFLKEMKEKCCDPSGLLGQKMSGNIMQEEIFPWEKQSERGDVAVFTNLLALDLSETGREWTQLNAERREIGTEIGGIIFEELREECVFDMLGLHCTLET